ncbi:hypothetical protein AB6A23_11055 [Paenibacillus tarimensis]
MRSKIIRYWLTDVELAYARAGRFDLIPTAADRGLTPENCNRPPESADSSRYRGGYKGKYPHVTPDKIKAGSDAGKTISELAEEFNIPRGTLSTLITYYGLTTRRKKA